MRFAIQTNGVNGHVHASAHELATELVRRGGQCTSFEDMQLQFVLNLSDMDTPRTFRRRHKSVFVVTLAAHPEADDETIKRNGYRTLIRTFSNLMICLVPNSSGRLDAHYITPEVGHYTTAFDPQAVCERIAPIVSSRWATDNRLECDLPARLYDGSAKVDELRSFGAKLDELGALPVPFPLDEILSNADMRHLYRIFGITGASYGNLSIREDVPEFGGTTFWMTGRGVDKRNLGAVGKDVLLVKEFDESQSVAVLSVPESAPATARVSVDAIEHWLIYQAYPDVKAIVHVHAWIDDAICTRQNYPCGTWELAREVCALLETAPDPSRCVIGLKNHGLTITGHSLHDIFERIEGKLLLNVPMFA